MMHSACEAIAEPHQITPRMGFQFSETDNQAQECIRKLSKQRKFVSLKRPVKFYILFY